MYRGKDSAGEVQGGPMYFITEGLGKSWRPLAVFFSVAGLVGALPVFNVNQLTQAINDIVLTPQGIEVTIWTKLIIGLVLVGITSIVILGGIQRIGKTTAKLVPFMVAIYFIAVLVILGINIEVLPKYLGNDIYRCFFLRPIILANPFMEVFLVPLSYWGSVVEHFLMKLELVQHPWHMEPLKLHSPFVKVW